jgi:hypothetical protein
MDKIENTVVGLAPDDVDIYDRDGFFWPLSQSDFKTVRDSFEAHMLALLKPGLDSGDSSSQAIRVLMYEIVRDVLMCWQAVALLRRTNASSAHLKIPTDQYGILSALEADEPLPTDTAVVQLLTRGIPAPKSWMMPLRSLRNYFLRRPIRWKSVGKLSEGDIVLLSGADFVTRHAVVEARSSKSFFLCSFWEWFSLSDRDRRTVKSMPVLSSGLLDNIVKGVSESFASVGETVPESVEVRIRTWILQTERLVRYYMDRIRSEPTRIPKTLWYGSVNNPWARMLRTAVEEHGGWNVGHDHGVGLGLRPNEGEDGPCFDLCDEFISYCPAFSEALNAGKERIKRKTTTGKVPMFRSAPLGCRVEHRSLSKNITASKPAFYLSHIYLGERVAGMNCLPADPVWVDWQYRLFKALREEGINMVFKAHPENLMLPSSRFMDETGAKVLKTPIQDCIDEASMFFVDFLSSPFAFLLNTDRPIIIFNHDFGVMSSRVRSIVERRCAIIDGTVGIDNRMIINWQEIKPAIELAEHRRKDRTCGNELYGYSL